MAGLKKRPCLHTQSSLVAASHRRSRPWLLKDILSEKSVRLRARVHVLSECYCKCGGVGKESIVVLSAQFMASVSGHLLVSYWARHRSHPEGESLQTCKLVKSSHKTAKKRREPLFQNFRKWSIKQKPVFPLQTPKRQIRLLFLSVAYFLHLSTETITGQRSNNYQLCSWLSLIQVRCR